MSSTFKYELFHPYLLLGSPTQCMMSTLLLLFHTTLLYLTLPEHCNQLALSSSRYICSVFHSNPSYTDNIPCTPNNALKGYTFNYDFVLMSQFASIFQC